MVATTFGDTSKYTDGNGVQHEAKGVHIVGHAPAAVEGPHTQIAFRSLATTNALVLSEEPCRLLASALACNGAQCFVKFYDKATAPSEADTPVLIMPLTSNTFFPHTQDLLGGRGIHFENGLAIRVTGLIAESDTTAIGAGQVLGFFALVA